MESESLESFIQSGQQAREKRIEQQQEKDLAAMQLFKTNCHSYVVALTNLLSDFKQNEDFVDVFGKEHSVEYYYTPLYAKPACIIKTIDTNLAQYRMSIDIQNNGNITIQHCHDADYTFGKDVEYTDMKTLVTKISEGLPSLKSKIMSSTADVILEYNAVKESRNALNCELALAQKGQPHREGQRIIKSIKKKITNFFNGNQENIIEEKQEDTRTPRF